MQYACRAYLLCPIWERLRDRTMSLEVYQDNQATARIMTTGRAPTLRHIKRTHCVSISWLTERVAGPDNTLHGCISEVKAADILTTHFTNRDTWEHICMLIGVCTQNNLVRYSRYLHKHVLPLALPPPFRSLPCLRLAPTSLPLLRKEGALRTRLHRKGPAVRRTFGRTVGQDRGWSRRRRRHRFSLRRRWNRRLQTSQPPWRFLCKKGLS